MRRQRGSDEFARRVTTDGIVFGPEFFSGNAARFYEMTSTVLLTIVIRDKSPVAHFALEQIFGVRVLVNAESSRRPKPLLTDIATVDYNSLDSVHRSERKACHVVRK